MSITNRCTFMAGGLDINMVYRERIYPAELCQQIRALSVLTAVSAVGCQRRLPCWWGWEGSAGGGCGSEEGWCLPKQKKRRVEGKEHMHLALKSQQLMQFSFCSDKNKNTPCVEVLPRGWWLWQQADHHYWSQLQQYPAVTETGCFNSNLKTADQRRETCVISSPLTVHWWWRQTERMPGSCPSDQA